MVESIERNFWRRVWRGCILVGLSPIWLPFVIVGTFGKLSMMWIDWLCKDAKKKEV